MGHQLCSQCLQAALAHPKCLVPGEKEQFLQANNDLLCQLQGSFMPLEGIAPQVFEAIYQRQQGEILWDGKAALLSQWSLVKATFVAAAATYCLLASAWVPSAG